MVVLSASVISVNLEIFARVSFFCGSFFQNLPFQKSLSGVLSECRMVCIQIRTDVLSTKWLFSKCLINTREQGKKFDLFQICHKNSLKSCVW